MRWSTTPFLLSHQQKNVILKEKQGMERKGGRKPLVEERAVLSTYFILSFVSEVRASFLFLPFIFMSAYIWFKSLQKFGTFFIWNHRNAERYNSDGLWAQDSGDGCSVACQLLSHSLSCPRVPLFWKSDLRVCFRILLNTVLLGSRCQLNLQAGGTSLCGFECKSGSHASVGIRAPGRLNLWGLLGLGGTWELAVWSCRWGGEAPFENHLGF